MLGLEIFGSSDKEGHKIDYRYAQKLGYSDRKIIDDDRTKNGDVVNWEDDRFLIEMGADVLPSELGLSVYETATVFDPSLKLGNEVEGSMLIKSGFDFDVANPPRVYEDGTIKLEQKVLSSSVIERDAMCVVHKDYGWMNSMHIHNLDTERGFQYKYIETMQLDGTDISVPLVSSGIEAHNMNREIVDMLVKSRLDGYSPDSDSNIRGELTDLTYNNGVLTYTLSSKKGSNLVIEPISELVKAGILRLRNRDFEGIENGWKVNMRFELFPESRID